MMLKLYHEVTRYKSSSFSLGFVSFNYSKTSCSAKGEWRVIDASGEQEIEFCVTAKKCSKCDVIPDAEAIAPVLGEVYTLSEKNILDKIVEHKQSFKLLE